MLKAIRNNLKDAGLIAVIGVGSTLAGDDAAGMMAAEALEKKIPKISPFRKIKIIKTETVPESFTGEIINLKPSHVVILDAADFGKKPGEVTLLDEKTIKGVTFSTHRLPPSIMIQYLKKHIDCSVMVVGFQPGCVAFGTKPSATIKKAAVDFVNMFIKALKDGE